MMKRLNKLKSSSSIFLLVVSGFIIALFPKNIRYSTTFDIDKKTKKIKSIEKKGDDYYYIIMKTKYDFEEEYERRRYISIGETCLDDNDKENTLYDVYYSEEGSHEFVRKENGFVSVIRVSHEMLKGKKQFAQEIKSLIKMNAYNFMQQ